MKLEAVKAALLAVLPKKTWHFEAPPGTKAPYAVWGEDGQGEAVHTDNGMACQAIQGTVDYFTRQEYDPNFDKIQRSLTANHIPYYLSSVQYERETGMIHYQWIWEAMA